MAHNVISYRKVAENTQILKIAKFAKRIWLPTSEIPKITTKNFALHQSGITCGAINEPSRSSKAIDKRVIINLCHKNVRIARFRDKHDVFYWYDKKP